MTVDFDIRSFLESQLPRHKRQPNRTMLYMWPLKELESLFEGFKQFREEMAYKANVTGETLSLESYMNKAVQGAYGGIKIVDEVDGGVWVSDSVLGTDYVEAGFSGSEPTEYVEVAVTWGEGGTLLDVNFKVYAPEDSDQKKIKAIVDEYKLAGMEYKIETYKPETWTADSTTATVDSTAFTL